MCIYIYIYIYLHRYVCVLTNQIYKHFIYRIPVWKSIYLQISVFTEVPVLWLWHPTAFVISQLQIPTSIFLMFVSIFIIFGAFHSHGGSPSCGWPIKNGKSYHEKWMIIPYYPQNGWVILENPSIFHGKSIYKWMKIRGYPYDSESPHDRPGLDRPGR